MVLVSMAGPWNVPLHGYGGSTVFDNEACKFIIGILEWSFAHVDLHYKDLPTN